MAALLALFAAPSRAIGDEACGPVRVLPLEAAASVAPVHGAGWRVEVNLAHRPEAGWSLLEGRLRGGPTLFRSVAASGVAASGVDGVAAHEVALPPSPQLVGLAIELHRASGPPLRSCDPEPLVVHCPAGGPEFDAFPVMGLAPHRVRFADRSDGDALSWFWEFGDGATSTERHPEHVHTSPGTYDVVLTVGHRCGRDVRGKFGYVNVFASDTEPWPGTTLLIARVNVGGSSTTDKVLVLDQALNTVHSFTNPVENGGFGELVKPLGAGRILVHLAAPGVRDYVGELDWDGNLLWEWHPDSEGAVAEFQRLSSGNTMVLTQVEESWPSIRPEPILNNYIREVTPAGTEVWSWSAAASWDELPFSATEREYLQTAPQTWILHLNSFALLGPNKWAATDARFDPRNLLISMREPNKVFIVEPSSGRVMWSFGRGIGQHHARMIPPGFPGGGNILIHDNGDTCGAPPVTRLWSRILEVDPTTGRIEWSFVDRPTFFNPFMGSVQRLPNGNTLIGEGANGVAFEVDADGNRLWTLQDESIRRFYRAYRVPFGWPTGPVSFHW